MATGGGDGSVEVRIAPEVWAREVGRLREGSPARVAAERERRRLEDRGLSAAELLACRSNGPGGTRLPDLLKVYVPIADQPASRRPFGFVLSPGRENGRPHLTLVAYGERHPREGTRSVYDRAHKRLHGRYPDQEVSRSDAAERERGLRGLGLGSGRGRARGGWERRAPGCRLGLPRRAGRARVLAYELP